MHGKNLGSDLDLKLVTRERSYQREKNSTHGKSKLSAATMFNIGLWRQTWPAVQETFRAMHSHTHKKKSWKILLLYLRKGILNTNCWLRQELETKKSRFFPLLWGAFILTFRKYFQTAIYSKQDLNQKETIACYSYTQKP